MTSIKVFNTSADDPQILQRGFPYIEYSATSLAPQGGLHLVTQCDLFGRKKICGIKAQRLYIYKSHNNAVALHKVEDNYEMCLVFDIIDADIVI